MTRSQTWIRNLGIQLKMYTRVDFSRIFVPVNLFTFSFDNFDGSLASFTKLILNLKGSTSLMHPA